MQTTNRLRLLALSCHRGMRAMLVLGLVLGLGSGVAACDLQRSDGNEAPGTTQPQPDPPGDDPADDPDSDPDSPTTDPLEVVEVQPIGAAWSGDGMDDADDPAIWIHPQDRSRSLVFLSDKARGIYVVDLQGSPVQHVDFDTRVNNIDVRADVPWDGGVLHAVAGNLRDVGKLALLRINPDWRQGQAVQVLCDAASSGNDISPDSYGFALYRRPGDGALFVFDKSDGSGDVRQWRIAPEAGGVRTTLVRTLDDIDMERAEGFVADDVHGDVYLAEEGAGIHRYRADPDDAVQTRTAFFATGDGIEGDREGLALYACADGGGYLVLSSQGNSTFKVYDRRSQALVRTFRAVGTHGTDGLDVTAASVPGLAHGFLVIHDEPGARYLVYDWSDVAGDELRTCGH